MGTMISISLIFDTGLTYSYSSNKGDFMDCEEKILPRNLKGIAIDLDISGFGVVEHYVMSESECMI